LTFAQMGAAMANSYNPDDDPDVFRLAPGDSSLTRSTHEGRDFMFAVLRYVDMSEADFYWASFHGAILEGAIMVRCDLRGAHFDGANMRGVDLRHANLGLDNIGGRTSLEDADLSGADLRNANIAGADFTRVRLTGADLRGVTATHSRPDRATCFCGADLSEAKLAGVDLRGAVYDAETRFPRGFRPEQAGMVSGRRKGG
jgi:uncharacterized protein YjbI with pentapeptide repeats